MHIGSKAKLCVSYGVLCGYVVMSNLERLELLKPMKLLNLNGPKPRTSNIERSPNQPNHPFKYRQSTLHYLRIPKPPHRETHPPSPDFLYFLNPNFLQRPKNIRQ
jgi:hypothetical protein